MRLSLGQEQRMMQKMVLAPRMIQSMEILQLPILALQERIDQEMEENPVLELKENDPDITTESIEAEPPDAPTDEEKELVIDENNNEDDFERLENLDEDWPEQFEERTRPSSSRIEQEGQRKHDAMSNMPAPAQSLEDYLHDQLGWFELEPNLRAMADRIIYNLDTNGWLPGSLDDLLGPDATAEDKQLAEAALALVQRLDPPGVGARDLRECLLLQLLPGIPFYEQLQTLISSYLEDIEHNRLPDIARRTGYSLDMIQDTLAELRKLNPKPGADFSEAYVPNVTPDVFIEPNDDGGYKVRLEDSDVPSLFISPHYRKLLLDPNTPDKTREYIKRKLNSAQWLIDSIQQRRDTITRVSQAIIDHQAAFLEKGLEAVEPLKMQQIADKVKVHVTTVSRAVDDKWIQTPRGIFPLKRFFVGGTVGADGEEVTWDSVRKKLKEIVDNEDKQKPFSDDALVKELAAHGIEVARRTVTKYRKAMGIPSSRQRREWKKG
ncbi:MAG: RNA polymerase factor sigma-54 [Planctomycetota bacterium]|nr:RNA polymerase factor sigma-54 [Planctomycetota bacterium]